MAATFAGLGGGLGGGGRLGQQVAAGLEVELRGEHVVVLQAAGLGGRERVGADAVAAGGAVDVDRRAGHLAGLGLERRDGLGRLDGGELDAVGRHERGLERLAGQRELGLVGEVLAADDAVDRLVLGARPERHAVDDRQLDHADGLLAGELARL
jgi:hypothetical protein